MQCSTCVCVEAMPFESRFGPWGSFHFREWHEIYVVDHFVEEGPFSSRISEGGGQGESVR